MKSIFLDIFPFISNKFFLFLQVICQETYKGNKLITDGGNQFMLQSDGLLQVRNNSIMTNATSTKNSFKEDSNGRSSLQALSAGSIVAENTRDQNVLLDYNKKNVGPRRY
jgi:hypothetical protein